MTEPPNEAIEAVANAIARSRIVTTSSLLQGEAGIAAYRSWLQDNDYEIVRQGQVPSWMEHAGDLTTWSDADRPSEDWDYTYERVHWQDPQYCNVDIEERLYRVIDTNKEDQ